LAFDAILEIYLNVADGLVVYEKVIRRHIEDELPFMATENILMQAVKKGGDRQELHERIRELSMKAAYRVKSEGLNNNLLELIAQDGAFNLNLDELMQVLKPERYVGRAPQQTEEFIKGEVLPILEKNKDLLGLKSELKV